VGKEAIDPGQVDALGLVLVVVEVTDKVLERDLIPQAMLRLSGKMSMPQSAETLTVMKGM